MAPSGSLSVKAMSFCQFTAELSRHFLSEINFPNASKPQPNADRPQPNVDRPLRGRYYGDDSQADFFRDEARDSPENLRIPVRIFESFWPVLRLSWRARMIEFKTAVEEDIPAICALALERS